MKTYASIADVSAAFDSLAAVGWESSDINRAGLAQRMRASAMARAKRRRTALALAAWCLLVLGAVGAAGAAHIIFNRLYTVTVTDPQTGQTLSRPRILVAPGQTAQMIIENTRDDGTVERLEVVIHPDGSVTSAHDGLPLDVDVDVETVPGPPKP